MSGLTIPKYSTSSKLLLIAVFGYSIWFLLSYQLVLWSLDDNGFVKIQHPRLMPPYWDFTNLWSGSFMAINDHVDWLFDIEKPRRSTGPSRGGLL